MINEIERLRNLLADETIKFDINKNLLRFSIINRDSEVTFSEFYNFDTKKEILSFIKNVIVPSVSISTLMEDNGDVVITVESKESFLGILSNHNVDNELIKICDGIYNEIDNLEKCAEAEIDMLSLIDVLNYEFSEGNFTMLSVDYGQNTKSYLETMYNDYENMEHIDILEEELGHIGLTINEFLDIIHDIDDYKDNLKDILLDKLPY